MHDVVDPNTAAWSRGQLKALKAGEAIDNLMGWEVNAPARYHFTFPWTLTEDDRAEYQGTEAALREDARRSGGGHVD
ncbi:MAG: hypothetical protein J2P22_04100 [Nocardioides sp.]|nr:hypothetical protein [Nocardioides sp.]